MSTPSPRASPSRQYTRLQVWLASDARAPGGPPVVGHCLRASARLPRPHPAHHDEEGSHPSQRPTGLGAVYGGGRESGDPQHCFFFLWEGSCCKNEESFGVFRDFHPGKWSVVYIGVLVVCWLLLFGREGGESWRMVRAIITPSTTHVSLTND